MSTVDTRRSILITLAYLDLTCAAIAGALWYLFPEFGSRPLAIALAPWLIRLLATRRLPERTPFDMPLLIFLITAGLSVWAAYDRETAWAKFWIIVGAILIYYAFANAVLADPENIPRRLAWLLAFFGTAVTFYFLATHDWNQYPGKIGALAPIGRTLQAQLPTLPGHRLHPNVAGGILAVLAPFAVAAALDVKRVDVKGIKFVQIGGGLLLLLLVLFGLMMSSSRGAWLGLTVAAILGFWWWLAGLLTRSRPRGHFWLFLAGLALPIITGVLFAGSRLETLTHSEGMKPTSSENTSVIDCQTSDLSACGATNLTTTDPARLTLYRNSLILVLDYPFIGAGLGGFMMLYSTYSFLLHVGFSTHSHNLYLDVAIEQGLFALFALLWTWILVAKQALRGAGFGVLRGAAALANVVLAFHGLVDDALYGSRALLLLFIPLAFFAGEVKGATDQYTNASSTWFKRQRFTLAAVTALVMIALIWYRPLLSLWYSNLAAVEQSRIELNAYVWPDWPIQDELRRQLDVSPAIKYYERALTLNNFNASANRRLGQIELSLGEYEDALVHLAASYKVMPWDNATRQLLGEAYLVNGRLAEGDAQWSTIDTFRGQLQNRLFWYEYIGDDQRLVWIRSSIPQ